MKLNLNYRTGMSILVGIMAFIGMSRAMAGTLAIAPPPPAPLCPVHYQQEAHGSYREIGKTPRHLPLLSGEGKHLDLSWVMKNTVPRGWSVVYGKGVPLHLSVTLKGSYTWTGRLRYLTRHYPLNITVNFNHRTVTLTKEK